MKYNLEHIPLKKVVSRDGVSYLSFRKSLTPNFTIVWRDIFLGYLFMFLFLLLYAWMERSMINQWVLIAALPVVSIIIAFWFANIQLFIHEAAHYNIHPDKKKNDQLANIFVGLISGTDIKAYRDTHWKHHLHLGKTNDTEHSYFNGLTVGFMLKMLTGIHVLSVIKNRNESYQAEDQKANAKEQQLAQKQRRMMVFGALFHLTLLAALFIGGYYFTMGMWILAVGVFYPFWGAIRQLLEHRDEQADKKKNFFKHDHGKVTRMFGSSLFSRAFGGAGFNKHLLHHWDPSVSYTNMDEMETFLENTEECGTIIDESRTTYLHTFIKLLRNEKH